MRYTLLQLVQSILRSMESDEVSDINETMESIAVADIVKECYFDIVGEMNMEEQEGLITLDASGDNTKPCLMTTPSTVSRIHWLKYNNGTLAQPDYHDLRFVPNDEYLYYQQGLDPIDTAIDQMSVVLKGGTFTFHFRNDAFPSYYTIFEGSKVVFDSYLATEESTLTTARIMGFGDAVPSFTLDNNWVPDLDPRQFQLLLQDAKSTAFMELKQTQNPKAEKKARKNAILTQKNKADSDPAFSNQNHAMFGRRSSPFTPMQRAMRQGR